MRRLFVLLAAWAALVNLCSPAAALEAEDAPPNVVLIFVDNFGNGDLGCFGSKLHRTPNIDRLAAEGTRFTSFYVASGVCTPSRAALMTGCYPRRVNLHVSGANTPVLRPLDSKGLNPDETTIAETLKAAGYATGAFGKWHLGDQRRFLPTRQGFDTFFGIPYSDDMTKDHKPDTWPELPLMRDEQVIEAPVDRDYLVRRCTEETIAFIERERERPFFVYLPHAMPGSTSHPFSSPAFRGKSANGDYGDSVEELDWSTGEIMKTLERLDLTERTLVIWTSDNGAVRRNPPQGSSAPYKGFGYDTSEGAMRMPCVMSWPGRIPAGACATNCAQRWTCCPRWLSWPRRLCQKSRSTGTTSGRFCWARQAPFRLGIRKASATTAWINCRRSARRVEALFAAGRQVRQPGRKQAPAKLELYDVRNDAGEAHEVSAQHPQEVKRLLAMAERAREEIGDLDQPGRGQRPAGHVDHPVALTPEQPK